MYTDKEAIQEPKASKYPYYRATGAMPRRPKYSYRSHYENRDASYTLKFLLKVFSQRGHHGNRATTYFSLGGNVKREVAEKTSAAKYFTSQNFWKGAWKLTDRSIRKKFPKNERRRAFGNASKIYRCSPRHNEIESRIKSILKGSLKLHIVW